LRPRGLFIVLEGGEGAGKSTLARSLAERFAERGMDVIRVREPGGTAAGELVRVLLHEPLAPWAETFAFLVARAQIVTEVIRPTLEAGTAVICDRFEASTFAYQGYARGLSLERLAVANADATGGLRPDLTLLLDIDPAVGLKRKHGETEAIRTGLETEAFHQKVRDGYLAQLDAAQPGTWILLDATHPPESVAASAWAAIAERLSEPRA
jgi:dTMP kinase